MRERPKLGAVLDISHLGLQHDHLHPVRCVETEDIVAILESAVLMSRTDQVLPGHLGYFAHLLDLFLIHVEVQLCELNRVKLKVFGQELVVHQLLCIESVILVGLQRLGEE